MPKNKPLDTSSPESIEEAWAYGDEALMVRAVIRKFARVLDMTDSGRDIKPLATGMFEAIDRLKAMEAEASVESGSQLADILAEADALLANV